MVLRKAVLSSTIRQRSVTAVRSHAQLAGRIAASRNPGSGRLRVKLLSLIIQQGTAVGHRHDGLRDGLSISLATCGPKIMSTRSSASYDGNPPSRRDN
jgi:hypothetical protein